MTTQIAEQPIDYQTIIPLVEYDESPADPEHRTHIINPPNNLHIWVDGMETQEIVDIARFTEQPVRALCGYEFVPKRNPEKFDACESCMQIAGDIMREAGE